MPRKKILFWSFGHIRQIGARLFEVADAFRQRGRLAREWKFNYALDEVNTSANQFGERGAINMVKREAQEDAQVIE